MGELSKFGLIISQTPETYEKLDLHHRFWVCDGA